VVVKAASRSAVPALLKSLALERGAMEKAEAERENIRRNLGSQLETALRRLTEKGATLAALKEKYSDYHEVSRANGELSRENAELRERLGGKR
jgi:hypothetical protein